jgi:hypothetical protein
MSRGRSRSAATVRLRQRPDRRSGHTRACARHRRIFRGDDSACGCPSTGGGFQAASPERALVGPCSASSTTLAPLRSAVSEAAPMRRREVRATERVHFSGSSQLARHRGERRRRLRKPLGSEQIPRSRVKRLHLILTNSSSRCTWSSAARGLSRRGLTDAFSARPNQWLTAPEEKNTFLREGLVGLEGARIACGDTIAKSAESRLDRAYHSRCVVGHRIHDSCLRRPHVSRAVGLFEQG